MCSGGQLGSRHRHIVDPKRPERLIRAYRVYDILNHNRRGGIANDDHRPQRVGDGEHVTHLEV